MPTSSRPVPPLQLPRASHPSQTSVSHSESPKEVTAHRIASPPPSSSAKPPVSPMGIDAFPDLSSPAPQGEVRVTGVAGTGEDEEREKFESAFPDLSGEVPYEAVRRLWRDSLVDSSAEEHTLISSLPNPSSTHSPLSPMDRPPIHQLVDRNLLDPLLPSFPHLNSATSFLKLTRTPSRSRSGGRSRPRRSNGGTRQIKRRGMRCPTRPRRRLTHSMTTTTR